MFAAGFGICIPNYCKIWLFLRVILWKLLYLCPPCQFGE